MISSLLVFTAIPILAAIVVALLGRRTGTVPVALELLALSSALVPIAGLPDTFSLPFVVATLLVTVCALLLSKRGSALIAGVLVTEAGVLLALESTDLRLVLAGWTLATLALTELTRRTAGPRRSRVATKQFLVFAVGLVALALATRTPSWMLLILAIASRMPVFPLHATLADVVSEAPSPVGVMALATGPLLGTRLLFELFTLLPEASHLAMPWLSLLGFTTLAWSSLAALAQRDLKRIVLFATVAGNGLVLLAASAVTAPALDGAALLAVSLALTSATSLGVLGVLAERAGHRHVDGFGGLVARLPELAVIATVSLLAAAGLPGTSGFAADLLALTGAFAGSPLRTWGAAAFLVLLAAALVWSLDRVFLGPLHERWRHLVGLSVRERVALWPLVGAIVVAGVVPGLVVARVHGVLGTLAEALVAR